MGFFSSISITVGSIISTCRLRCGAGSRTPTFHTQLGIEGLLPLVADTLEIPIERVGTGATSLISGLWFTRLRCGGRDTGAEIGAEGDAASTPRGFSGCGEFPALFTTPAMRSRRRALSASLMRIVGRGRWHGAQIDCVQRRDGHDPSLRSGANPLLPPTLARGRLGKGRRPIDAAEFPPSATPAHG